MLTAIATPYEVLSTACRTIDYVVTARDNALNQPLTDNKTVSITTDCNSGPFVVTSQAAAVTFIANGINTFTVNWNVAGTNAGAVNCANVKISLSDDGGYTYCYVLAASTPNDGSQTFVVPNFPTVAGRIKVEAVGNVFYHINAANITIQSACAAQISEIDNISPISASQNDPSLAFTLNNAFGTVISPTFTGTISTADIPTNFAPFGVGGIPCQVYQHLFAYYESYPFEVNTAGTYTFNNTTPATQINMAIYEGNFDAELLCNNLIGSSFIVSTLNAFTTVTLSPNKKYIALFHSTDYNINLPLLYNISVSMPAGASLISAPLSPVGYLYSYVIVNTLTGNIAGISSSTNIDMTTYPMGSYQIYGISHDAPNLNPYIGTSFATFSNSILPNLGVCGKLSKQSKPITILAPLPVEILEFDANLQGNDVEITWQSFNEIALDHYFIEHAEANRVFEKITDLKALNIETHNTYKWQHKKVGAGKHYYKLYAVDIDGKVAYKGIRSVMVEKSYINLYPNPAQDNINLVFDGGKREGFYAMIEIYDAIGKNVYKMPITLQNGTNTHQISTADFPKGYYVLKCDNGTEMLNMSFVKE